MKKKMVATGLAAGLLAGTGAGLVLELAGNAGAQGTVTPAAGDTGTTDTTDPTSTTDTTGTPDTTGTDDAADPAADRTARLTEVLQPLVDDGTLTQAQMDKVIETLAAAGPIGGDHGGRGGMRGGFGSLSVVATTLGMTEAEVRDAISSGQTLAQLAESKGSTGQALIDAILAEFKAHLDEEVAAGEHTQAEADAKLADATTRVTELVNNTDAAKLGGPGGPDHGGPHGDRDGDGADDAGTDAVTDSGSIDGGPADSAASTEA